MTAAETNGLAPPPFEPFPSIPRLSRACIVTEKIDGTNGVIHVGDDGRVLAGSRSKWLTPDEPDNFGFARWVAENADALRTGLGPGTHFGEWWGAGIQRRYGQKTKRFSLFNVARWGDDDVRDMLKYPLARPDCCDVVPVLYRGPFETPSFENILAQLAAEGSRAAPGFMQPEGIVVWHDAARVLFKKTIGGDGHKGAGR